MLFPLQDKTLDFGSVVEEALLSKVAKCQAGKPPHEGIYLSGVTRRIQ